MTKENIGEMSSFYRSRRKWNIKPTNCQINTNKHRKPITGSKAQYLWKQECACVENNFVGIEYKCPVQWNCLLSILWLNHSDDYHIVIAMTSVTKYPRGISPKILLKFRKMFLYTTCIVILIMTSKLSALYILSFVWKVRSLSF